MTILYIVGGIFSILFAFLYYYPTFFYIFIFLLYSIILILLAVLCTIYIHFLINSQNPARTTNHQQTSQVLHNALSSSIFDPPKPIQNSAHLPIIFGRTVDGLLIQIIEYTLRDFVSPWLGYVVRKPRNLNDVLREDIWNGVNKLRDRALKIDAPKILAVDITIRLTVHLEKIKIAKARALETGSEPIFASSTYLESDDKELEFLSKLSEIIIIYLLPRCYSLPPLKHLLSEILSYKIFYPAIQLITSPDYINQKIVQFIENRLAVAAISKRSYEYAASFEDFLKIITNSTNLDELLLIRTSILNDIMQATTMQNLQRAKGLDPDLDETQLTKTELLAGLKLKRYINQLTYAKIQCEKNLTKYGWQGNYTNDLNLSMIDILSTVIGRRYFTIYLETLKASDLVGFYTSVEELKHSGKSSYHQLGSEIFYTYIRAPLSEIKVDKSVRTKMESFLLGDLGPEIFYETQKTVLKTLEEKYYSPFLSSEQYKQLKNALTTEKDISSTSFIVSDCCPDDQIIGINNNNNNHNNNNSNNNSNDNSDIINDLTNHSTYARNKLDQLQEKLENKNQALNALKSSLKPESKVLTILEKEVDWLKMEKRQLEAHLTRTEIWGDHMGKWRATVQSVEVPDEKEPPQFMILVQADDIFNSNGYIIDSSSSSSSSPLLTENISSGWVVLRSLTEFHELHRKLRHLCTELRNFELPSTTFKLFFMKNEKNSLEKAKIQIQKYLNFILEEDHLYQSESVYEFLSPSSEHLKHVMVTPLPKKSKFSLATLFKSNESKEQHNRIDVFWGPCGQRDGEEDITLFLEGIGSTSSSSSVNDPDTNNKQIDADGKDSIAEPLYALLGEIFDMGGVFKWIRRSLISFVQITYGRTINRQIRDSINYLFDEIMLHYYTSTALKSFWPGGVLASEYPERNQDTMEMTATAARSLLIDNIPEVLCNLVGAQTAKIGAIKVFDILQNQIYNKQLFYEFIEILMLELFPEIRQLNN